MLSFRQNCSTTSRTWLPLAGLLAALAVMLLGFHSTAQPHPGRWSPSADWSSGDERNYAVHLVLLPGDGNPYHSRVLWWMGQRADTMWGGQWGWTPGNEGCATFPTANFADLGLAKPGMDIFCGGHIQMPDLGRLLVIGGTDTMTGDFGENRVRIFTPGTGTASGTWSSPESMKNWRWYAGSVALRDGRLVAMSGDMHRRHSIFGGRTSLSQGPQGDSLYRFASVDGGAWWPAIIPDEESPGQGRPDPREGHSAVLTGSPFAGQAIFGGRKTNGDALNDFWILRREPNALAPDYRYWWAKRTPSNPPAQRSEHSAIVAWDTMMVVYGGLDQNNAAIGGEPHRLHFRSGPGWEWQEMSTTGTGPGARLGHAAVYDTTTLTVGGLTRKVHRMIVFGGVSAPGATPSDTTVYELRFDPSSANSARWIPMTQVNLHPGLRGPAPRHGHTLNWDPVLRPNQAINKHGHTALMYGGALGNGAYSDTLWALWTFPDSTVGWQPLFPGTASSSGPGPRARHSATLDPGQFGRLYIFGGETSTMADAYVHAVDAWRTSSTGPWMRWDDAIASRTRQSALVDAERIVARMPEAFDPAAGTWTVQTSAPLWQPSYPPTFLVPGGAAGASRVLTLDGNAAYWTEFAAAGQAGAWQQFGSSTMGFSPQGGVQYRPGRIMAAGGKSGSAVTGLTKTLDASSTSNNWTSSGSMEPRFQHNLVAMPDGKVLAVGGVNHPGDIDPPTYAVHRPQVWNPASGTWTPFTGADTLAAQPTARTHHSTAILLPDGRILSAGGEADGHKNRADLYCPPYLFRSNGDPAARPVIDCAPSTVTWGKTYSIQVADTAGIRSASLIRPGATTHAHDQNQRFVPVNFTKLGSPARLLVTVPATSDTAPPGYYMLFLTGSADGPDVPSIARWVQMGSSATDDACDPVAPAAVADLSGCYHYYDPYQGTIDLAWSAPADDGTLAVTGPARQYDIRYSYQPITGESQFNSATPVGGTPPAPEAVGTLQTHRFGNFSPNTTVYFRMKTLDDRGQYVNASALSNQAVVYTSYDCYEGFFGGSGGGGGESRARRVAGVTSAQMVGGEAYVENSLLDGARFGEPATDLLRLAAAPRMQGGAYAVRIRAAGTRAAAFDAVRLRVVDHPPGLSTQAIAGSIVVGSRVPAAGVTRADGADLGASLDGSAEVIVPAGEILTVELDETGSTPPQGTLLLEAKSLGGELTPDGSGIEIQVADGSGGWQTLAHRHPRREFAEVTAAPLSEGAVRLRFLSACALRFVGRFVPEGEPASVQETSLLAASSNHLGDAVETLSSRDSASVTLAGPDTLRLRFSVPPLGEGLVREFFLVVEATLEALRPSGLAPAAIAKPAVPTRFALHQNRPNPFHAGTTIHFDLPAGAMVRLEVFDVLGRRVRRLAHRWYPPGFHAVEWDARGAGGEPVGPGVYFYRIQAGANRDGKKMLLTP